MSKVVRLDEDAIDIALSYGGDISEGIRIMQTKMNSSSLTKEDLRKEMDRLREGIKEVHKEYMKFISSGQGAVRIQGVQEFRIKGQSRETDYPPSVPASMPGTFKIARQLKEEKEIPINEVK